MFFFFGCRQSAAKQILDVLQQAVASVEAYSDSDEVEKVFASITKLSRDDGKSMGCALGYVVKFVRETIGESEPKPKVKVVEKSGSRAIYLFIYFFGGDLIFCFVFVCSQNLW